MKTKQRTLAVLLLLALLLGGLLWLVTRSNTAEEAASSAAAEGTIPLSSFAIGDLEQLQYIYGGETITLNYDSGSWTLADDPDYHLDTSACSTMATALASLNAKRQLTAQSGEDYGLTDPAVTVTVTGKRPDQHVCVWHREPGHRGYVCAKGRRRRHLHRVRQQGCLF